MTRLARGYRADQNRNHRTRHKVEAPCHRAANAPFATTRDGSAKPIPIGHFACSALEPMPASAAVPARPAASAIQLISRTRPTRRLRRSRPRRPSCYDDRMALALRPLTIGSPIYVHLADYEVMEDGHSIGRIMQERAEEPRDPERALVMVADDRQGAPRRHQDVGLRRGSSPDISHYLCTVSSSAERCCRCSKDHAAWWRQETRERWDFCGLGGE
jgi:hypothetical protein